MDGCEEFSDYPPPCPPAVGITPATPTVPSRPLTPASRSSPSHTRIDTISRADVTKSDTGHGLKRTPSWTIKVQS